MRIARDQYFQKIKKWGGVGIKFRAKGLTGISMVKASVSG
jgi:hypothetical protein